MDDIYLGLGGNGQRQALLLGRANRHGLIAGATGTGKTVTLQTMAEQFSAAPSASAGGDLNWLSPGDMRPEVAEAVLKAPAPPNVLPPIESEGGIYIIALTGKREPSDPTKSTILDMEQVIARGEGSTAKLEALKTKAATCGDLTKSLEAVEGITRTLTCPVVHL